MLGKYDTLCSERVPRQSLQMQVIHLPSGHSNELKLSGEVDFHRSPRLRAILRVKLREKHPVLVLECSDLEYIDSCGMAALLEYARDAKVFGGRMTLVALKPALRTIFEIVQLDQHLLLAESGEQARSAS